MTAGAGPAIGPHAQEERIAQVDRPCGAHGRDLTGRVGRLGLERLVGAQGRQRSRREGRSLWLAAKECHCSDEDDEAKAAGRHAYLSRWTGPFYGGSVAAVQ